MVGRRERGYGVLGRVLDWVFFWVERGCEEDFGKDCKSVRGKVVLVI